MLAHFDYSAEVLQAKQDNKPILALESTLITHGLPAPYNQEIALSAENIVRAANVVPATIAILNGQIKIGLTTDELEQLINDKTCVKASTRDLPYLLTQKLSAGTTVAATAFCAHVAGIKTFATGGIGGVHRGNAMDISADLIAISKTPIAIVCSGAKVILDLAKTLEFLETYSIPIVGYQTEYLPGFYCAQTPHKLPAVFNTLESLAQYLHVHWQCNSNMGVIVANAIPHADEIPLAVIEPVINQALQQATAKQITGKAITPFLLNAIREMTAGKSLTANLSLIKNNVRVGAELAKIMY